MHRIYVCEGIVLGKRGVGEANTLVYILTRDLGLVRGVARSSRAEQSKLRYGLEPLTQARFSFVRGKHEWRLTGVEGVVHMGGGIASSQMRAAGKIAKLLLRLIHGEEVAPDLYSAVKQGLEALVRAESPIDAQSIESVLVLKILYHLGYLPHSAELRGFIDADLYSIELAQEAARSRALLVRAINESLQATGL